MTRQEAFNRVWGHAILDRKPPSFENQKAAARCRMPRYYDASNNRCFIGLFILPGEWHPTVETHQVSSLWIEYFRDQVTETSHLFPESLEELGKDLPFLNDLQQCHDNTLFFTGPTEDLQEDLKIYFPEVEVKLRKLAKKYDLTLPESSASPLTIPGNLVPA
jgi:hypothetical protein